MKYYIEARGEEFPICDEKLEGQMDWSHPA